MKHLYKAFLLTLIIFSYSCSKTINSALEEVYKLAGSNKKELKQVIMYYSTDPADSLKLKAAEFLILNMVGKYSECYEAPWQDVATLNMRWSSSSDKEKVLNTYKVGETIRRDDLTHIKADYLITNIDLAFRVWEDKPWGKHISFDTFCEEILPYRIGTEPLENWREKVLASFADVDNMLKEDSTLSAVEACSRVNDILPRFRMDKDFSNMSFTQLMATTRGQCDSQAALAAFVMRALGIPVTIDFTPQWKEHPTGHDWNSVCDSTGNHISFMGTETNPNQSHQGNTFQKAKAYRNTFKNHKIIDADSMDIPSLFEKNLYDISSEHQNMIDASLPLRDGFSSIDENIYLSLFYDFDWRITGHADADADSIYFHHIGEKILYLPVYYKDDRPIPAANPFYVDNKGEIIVLGLGYDTVEMAFNVISNESDNNFPERMINSVFEISKDDEFSEAKTIHKITKLPKTYNRISFKNPYSSQYVRLMTPEEWCNVSEIAFYDTQSNKLEGKHIGTPGSYNNLGNTGDKAFDDDITTFYDAENGSNSWTGLDFGEIKVIAHIEYSPRLKGVGVYKGYEYELFGWTINGWEIIDNAVATNESITFKMPDNGLFYISNKTADKRGQVFFLANGEVTFYE